MSRISSTEQYKDGFTIVELLIVIVVIGILAAITIVAYGGITGRANAVKYQTDAVALVKKAESYNAIKGGYPLTAAGSDLTSVTAQTTAGTNLTTTYNGGTSSQLPTGIAVFAVSGSAPSFLQALNGVSVAGSTDFYFVQYCATGKGMYVYYPDPSSSTTKSMTVGVCP